MNKPREDVAVALFNRLKGVQFLGPDGQTLVGFQSTSRKGQMWDNVPPANQPSLMLFQVAEEGTQKQAIGLYKWTIKFWCLIYLRADATDADSGATVETQINSILDAIEKAMQPIIGEKQTLGGLVNNAWIEGDVVVDTGIIDQQCAIVIPILAQTGS